MDYFDSSSEDETDFYGGVTSTIESQNQVQSGNVANNSNVTASPNKEQQISSKNATLQQSNIKKNSQQLPSAHQIVQFQQDYNFYGKDDKTKETYQYQEDNLRQLLNRYSEIITEFEERKHYVMECNQINTIMHEENLAYEVNMGIFDLVHTENPIFNKVCITFAFLDEEVNKIVDLLRTKYFDILLQYGEVPNDHPPLQPGDEEVMMGRALGVFKQVFSIVKYSSSLVFSLVQQLNALYSKQSQLYKAVYAPNINLFSVLDTLGKLLGAVYTIDQIIQENKNVKNHWSIYKRMMKIAKDDCQKYNINLQQIKVMEKNLIRMDRTVMTNNCLNAVLSQDFDSNKKSNKDAPSQMKDKGKTQTETVRNNKELMLLFHKYFKFKVPSIQQSLQSLCEQFQSNNKDSNANSANSFLSPALIQMQQCYAVEIDTHLQTLGLLQIYLLYRRLYLSDEQREVWKQLWELQKKQPFLILHSYIIKHIAQFMQESVPLAKKASGLQPKDSDVYIGEYMKFKDETFVAQIKELWQEFNVLVVRMESVITSNDEFINHQNKQYISIEERLKQRLRLLIHGGSLAQRIKQTMLNTFLLHLQMKEELKLEMIHSLLKGVQMLKALRYLYQEKEAAFSPQILHRELSAELSSVLIPALKKLQSELDKTKQKQGEKQETFNALWLLNSIVKGPNSPTRLSIINFALDFSRTKGVLQTGEYAALTQTILKLQYIAQYKATLDDLCHCGFLYWSKELLPYFFQLIYTIPNEPRRIRFLFTALEDIERSLQQVIHLEKREALKDSFKKEILNSFQNEYIVPLKREVEDYLLIHIHSVMVSKIEAPNPFKSLIKTLNDKINVDGLILFGVKFHIKNELAFMLNDTFYNRNILNMHDHQTYEAFRVLALCKFDIDLMDVYIPKQTLDQGSQDILSILRGIQTFVVKYKYNLYNQTFMEVSCEKKHIGTLGITQLSDSINTHGFGMLNTVVNAIYKFVLKKFSIFSKFLYDTLIQNLLVRDHKYMKKHRKENEDRYPFDKAKTILKEIKRIGNLQNGDTYIDKFRVLISSIGNSLGLVRLIRTASLKSASSSVKFIPDFDSKDSSSNQYHQINTKAAGFSVVTQGVGKDLDTLFSNLKANFSQKTDYLKLFVGMFDKLFGDNQAVDHLKLFYMIIPTLTISYIENMLISKEKLDHQNPINSFIYDDGFAVGIMYFLKVLGQNEQYDSLHWEDEVKAWFEQERLRMEKEQQKLQTSKLRVTEELNVDQNLSGRKLKQQEEEFILLFYALHASSILFRDIKDPNEEDVLNATAGNIQTQQQNNVVIDQQQSQNQNQIRINE